MKKFVSKMLVIFTAGALFVACGGEPKSVAEFEKISSEDLDKFIKKCKNESYEKEAEKYALTGKASKAYLECENALKAKLTRD